MRGVQRSTEPGGRAPQVIRARRRGRRERSAWGDKHFVKEATEGSNADIALGKLAQEKSNSQGAKDFAQRMVTEQMAPVAQQMGITTSPDQIPAKDKPWRRSCGGCVGTSLTKRYIQAIEQGLEVIQQHLQMAQQLAQAHNVSVGGGPSSATGQ